MTEKSSSIRYIPVFSKVHVWSILIFASGVGLQKKAFVHLDFFTQLSSDHILQRRSGTGELVRLNSVLVELLFIYFSCNSQLVMLHHIGEICIGCDRSFIMLCYI